MPQLDTTTYASQIFWLLATFVPLYLILWRVVLPKISGVLESRREHVEGDLRKAELLKQEAEEILADYEKAQANGRAEAAAMIRKAAEEIAAEQAERHAAFGEELAGRIQEGEKRIAAAKAEALENLAQVAGDIASAATAKLIGVNLSGEEVGKAVEEAAKGRN